MFFMKEIEDLLLSDISTTNNQKIIRLNGIPLMIPKNIEDICLDKADLAYKPYEFLGLQSCLRSGEIAFDIGSSYGLLAALMAKWVGRRGMIYSFEAQQGLLDIATLLCNLNGLDKNMQFCNFLVWDSSYYSIPKHNKAELVSDKLKTIIHNNENKIPLITIDNFCREREIFPNCIRISAQGTESNVIKGMKKTLENHFPNMVIKIHGKEIENYGERIDELVEYLESIGYHFFDLKRGSKITRPNIVNSYSHEIGYLLASVKLKESEYLHHLEENITPKIMRITNEKKIDVDILEVRTLVDTKKFDEVIKRFSHIPVGYDSAEMQYCLAFSLHQSNQNLEEAIKRYTSALRCGYSPFWIFYNRGSLYYQLGSLYNAYSDLKKADDLDPEHKGVKQILDLLKKQNT